MEKESQVVEDQSIPPGSPPTTTSGPCSSSVNRSLPSAPDSPLSRPPPGPPPPTTGSSAVHALQTKVKTLTQRRQRGRERERERDNNRDKFDSAVKPVAFDHPAVHHAATSLVPPTRERARCNKGYNSNNTTAPPPFGPTWRRANSPLSKSSSSEEGEEEVEVVQVKLEIHSPPPEAPGGVAMGRGEERSAGGGGGGGGGGQISDPSDQPRGLGEGASLENLTHSSSSSGKEALPPPPPAAAPPPPTPASTSASSTRASAATTSASPSSSTTSSSTTRHWAPPKGFWRIVRPETLLLNGVPSSSSAPLRDHTATQTATQTAAGAAAEPRRKASQSEEATAGGAAAVGLGSSAPDDGEAVPPSEFKHSDSLDCYLDRYEQSEAEIVSTMRPVSATALLRVDSGVEDSALLREDSALLRVDSGVEDSALLRVDRGVEDRHCVLLRVDSGVEDSALLRVDSGVEDSVLLRVDSGVEDSVLLRVDSGVEDSALLRVDSGVEDSALLRVDRGLEDRHCVLLRVDSGVEDSESSSTQSGMPSIDERAEEARQRACRRPAVKERQRQHTGSREEGEQSSGRYGDEAPCKVDCEDDQASDSSIPPQELGQCPRSLIGPEYELALSPRHEQAKRLLERARLKARSKGDRPTRRSQSDQRCHTKRQSAGPAATPARQPQTADLLTPAPLEIQDPSAAADLGGLQPPRSPTRVRFEDESEKEAESRYLDRQRDRGRPGGAAAGGPKTKNIKAENNNNPDCSDSGSDRGRSRHGGVSTPPALKEEDATAARCHVTTVIKEVIVLVKKCEACGSVVREPASAPLPEAQTSSAVEPQQLLGCKADETQTKTQAPSRPEASSAARPKAPLTVTFAGAFVLGESKDSEEGSETRRNSEFGKLRRRSRKGSRKGESGRLESGHGPYGPSWARRNSNPRSRAGGGAGGKRRAVSFAPGRPVAVDPRSLGSGLKPAPPTQSLPIKSALKSSSKNRSEGSNPYSPLAESQGQRGGEVSKASSQGGTPMTTCLVPCVRPSTLRYSEARLTTDLPSSELWDATPNGTGMTLSDFGQRALVLSRPEDLRAELLRSEHLKAEVHWEETSDGSRKLVAERDGRPKLSLRRFLSSIGLNSVGRLVKSSARSSSMEQLSIPAPPPRASSASPTRRPPDPNIRRRPSLQTMHSHTVFPLAQLRKASSVQSLERRTERSTILGEVQLPYGLAPSPESPQMEEAVVVRPVGRVSQAFPDGTLLLELTRPPNGPFGFVISRGKGRSDASGKTGVYVEKVGDGGSGGEGLYVGLLGVGDEILEVNGEAVAGFSLDQVTRLLTRDSTAFIRTAPSSARRNQR